MTISQVALSNTFGEFRTTFNDAANAINYFDTTVLTGTLTVNTSATHSGTTQSTSTTTGALKVAGGVGIVKNLYVGGNTIITDTTQASNTTSGSLQTAGGAGVAKALYVGDLLSVSNNVTIETGRAYQINSSNVLSSTVLGSTVLASSLTSVGTLTTLAAGNTTITGTLSTTGAITASGGVDKLTTTSGVVSVSASAAPVSGYALIATSATTATWQTIPFATTGKAIAMAMVFGS